MIFPGGKRCAFSVFDDTDVATLESIRPVYDYLSEHGIYTTKTVWSIDWEGPSDYEGSHTLQNPAYAAYAQELKRRGFEIAFHGAGMESSERGQIDKALANFREAIGGYPTSNAAHGRNRDNLYWGTERFTYWITKRLYSLLSGDDRNYFQGHVKSSPYFWGDIARERIKYVRSFTYTGINLLERTTPVVYRNKKTPFVNAWFLTNDAENVEEFNALLSRANQEKLEKEGGLCIISTHFGKGFVKGDQLNAETARLLHELSKRECWFAPVSDLLDYYVSQVGLETLSAWQLLRLELSWFLDARRRRRTRKEYTPTELEYLNRARL